jgi:flagellar motor component MotA
MFKTLANIALVLAISVGIDMVDPDLGFFQHVFLNFIIYMALRFMVTLIFEMRNIARLLKDHKSMIQEMRAQGKSTSEIVDMVSAQEVNATELEEESREVTITIIEESDKVLGSYKGTPILEWVKLSNGIKYKFNGTIDLHQKSQHQLIGENSFAIDPGIIYTSE